jgi:hypothetical protein
LLRAINGLSWEFFRALFIGRQRFETGRDYTAVNDFGLL